MLDLLITNGKIIDGSGAPAYTGSIGVRQGKLVMNCDQEEAAQVIDAHGRVVCPGFIDAHSHGDRINLLGQRDGQLFKTGQGITTQLCGQCGGSNAPITPERAAALGRNWTSFEQYVEYVKSLHMTANIRFYIGHGTLRFAVMGNENRPATPQELDRMKGLLRESMEAGAAGMSTGLIYVPGCYADTHELVELAKVTAPFNGIYASHMRNESFAVEDAVKEAIHIGRESGVRVSISHHKVCGLSNWGRQKNTLALIAQANQEGVHVTCDQYPYPRNMTVLSACIPNWYFAQTGNAGVTRRLEDPAFRHQLRREMEDPATPYDNYYLNAGGWDGIFITTAPRTPEAAGLFVSEYAEKLGKDPWDCYFDLMQENACTAEGVFCTMSEDDLCDIIRSPYCVVGTDGCTISWSSQGHPRASSTFPHAIDFYVRQKKILTLEEMIHKMTGLTAERLLVPNKGLLRDGYDADVLIIDYDHLKDKATYSEPNQQAEGIDYVIVGGEIVYHDLTFTGAAPGQFIPHRG